MPVGGPDSAARGDSTRAVLGQGRVHASWWSRHCRRPWRLHTCSSWTRLCSCPLVVQTVQEAVETPRVQFLVQTVQKPVWTPQVPFLDKVVVMPIMGSHCPDSAEARGGSTGAVLGQGCCHAHNGPS